ncbi:MAG: ketoacyl-ACP synthase III [Muribaculaceae bacterium]|nr:ketoacyl-ACP synthase III [Muribaculaceae bacterium]
MSKLIIDSVRIAGMAACVPLTVEDNLTLPIFSSQEEAQKVIASTGIRCHRAVKSDQTASDLAVKAVGQLLSDLKWEPSDIDCLFYVCTSRDFIAPQTACILQDRLGLRNDCFVMDLPLGCSGWVYGMSVIGSMMSHGSLKKGLLIAAETNTRNRSKTDRTVRPLFGDAATVTALEYDPSSASPMRFSFGVDGSGYKAVWAKYGGMRYPVTPESLELTEYEPGVSRRGTDMVVNGMDVFGFAIKTPPNALKEFIAEFEVDTDKLDLLLLHQANKFIDEKIRKSLKIPAEKVPYCMEEFGNVTSASIPLTLVARCSETLRSRPCYMLACGFGVGLAWATMDFSTDRIVVSPIVEL